MTMEGFGLQRPYWGPNAQGSRSQGHPPQVEGGEERTVIQGWMALGKDLAIVPKHLRRQRKNENHEGFDNLF